MLIEPISAAAPAAGDDFARAGLAVLRNGFSPVPITPGSRSPSTPHFKDYFREPPSYAQVEDWQGTYPNHGLGVCLGFAGLLCVKIDAGSAELSQAIATLVQSKLKTTPLIRSGANGSLALFFRLDGIDRKRLDTVQLAGTVNGSVSFWLEGMQVVAFGAHSQTGQNYVWLSRTPEDTHINEVPAVTRKALVRALKAVRGRFGRKSSSALPTDLMPITRDTHTGKVISGHETYLRALVYERLYHFFQVYAVTAATADKLHEIAEAASTHFNAHTIDAPKKLTKVERAEEYVRQTVNAAGSDVLGFFCPPTRVEFVTALVDAEDPEGSLYNPVATGRGREMVSEKIRSEVTNATAINIGRERDDERQVLSDLPFSNVRPPVSYNSYRHRVLKVTTGVGKSTAMRTELLPFLYDAAARERAREGATIYGRVIVLVPNHKLAREWVANLNKTFEGTPFTVAHSGGRHTEHPNHIGEFESDGRTKVGYCHESMSGLTKALASKGQHNEQIDYQVCRTCPLVETCRYHLQKPAVADADVVISVHNYLNSGPPEFWGKGFGLVVVDEDCSSLADVNIKERTVTIDELTADLFKYPVRTKGEDGIYRPDATKTEELRYLTQRTVTWLTSQAGQDGPIDLASCLLEDKQLERIKSLNWARTLRGAVPDDEAGLAKYPSRGIISKRNKLVTATLFAKKFNEQWRQAFGHYGARFEGGSVTVHMSNRPHKSFEMVPILALDASYSPAMAGEYLYPAGLLAEVEVRADYRHVALNIGQFGMQRIFMQENIDLIVEQIKGLGSANGLLITTKDAEPYYKAALAEAGLDEVPTLHHNALAGLDSFGGVDWLVIAGITRLPPGALLATCRDRGYEPTSLEREDAVVYDPAPGGGKKDRKAKRYIDPLMRELDEAHQIACLAQAEGRARAVNRGPDNPLKVLVFVSPSCAMPFPVDEVRYPTHETPGFLGPTGIASIASAGVFPLTARLLAPGINAETPAARLKGAKRTLKGFQSEVRRVSNGDVLAYLRTLNNRRWQIVDIVLPGERNTVAQVAVASENQDHAGRLAEAFKGYILAQEAKSQKRP